MPSLVYAGREFFLEGKEFVLGRNRECSIPIEDAKASRRHARVFRQTEQDHYWWVEDLQSVNGTDLNGTPLNERRLLRHGDRIGIGRSRITYKDAQEATDIANQALMPNAVSLVGREIGGHNIVDVIGRGALGTVYKATQVSVGREVAFKVLNSDLVHNSKEFAEHFLSETRAAGNVSHEGIVHIYECGVEGDLLWYSMEIVDGESLADLLQREEKLPAALAFLVIERAAQALKAAHDKKVVHHDVNPANIMITKQGAVKVLDLGLAKLLRGEVSKYAAKYLSPNYLAPEQVDAHGGDQRCDVYSLGCVLYHALAGRPPYFGKNPVEIIAAHSKEPVPSLKEQFPELMPKLDEVLHGTLDKNPDWRYASMQEMINDLRILRSKITKPGKEVQAIKSDSHSSSSESPTERLARLQARDEAAAQGSRTQVLAVCLLIAVIALVVASFTGVGIGHQPEKPEVKAPALPPMKQKWEYKNPEPTPRVAPVSDAKIAEIRAKWQTVQAQVDRDVAGDHWSAAERQLAQFTSEAAADPATSQAVFLRHKQLQLDGDTWYRKQLAGLPAATAPDSLAKTLTTLSRLRDVTLSPNRPDAESRYQSALARSLQRMQEARRQSRQQLESGHPEKLPELAAALEPVFRGTPIAGMHRQFDAQAKEAARLQKSWKGSWSATLESFKKATGEQALVAGAALLLSGDADGGKKLLFGDATLDAGDLLKRREAILGHEAAILAFTDPGDLQFVETLQGDLQFSDGVLSGTPGEACGLACTIPIGGDHWDVSLTATLANQDAEGQAVISCCEGDTANFLVRIESDNAVVRAHVNNAWEERNLSRPTTAPLKLRLMCRGGKLQLLLNNEVHFDGEAQIPKGSRLRFEVAGLQWKLDDLQVVGGE